MQVWKLIPNHEDPGTAFDLFCKTGSIAVGWTNVGDLSRRQPSAASDISRWIRDAYPNLQNSHLGGPSLWYFLRGMRPGDQVLISSQGKRYGVFEVLGDYAFTAESDAILGYRHRRAAVLTDLDPEVFWVASGREPAPGHSTRWTVAMLNPTEQVAAQVFEEGRRHSVTSTAIERSPEAREACLRHHGTACLVCGFVGEDAFGAIGKDLIHVHHLVELAATKGMYKIDPIKDLVPLCPTCHAMAHRRIPAYTVLELSSMLRSVS